MALGWHVHDTARMISPPERIELEASVLRRERPGDEALVADAVAANLGHLRPWMPWAVPEAATVEAQRERETKVEEWWEDGSLFNYLLLDPAERALRGIFGLHRRVGPRALELGYWLDRDATGQGHATAAARALTDEALTLDDVERVEIHCDEANERSQRVPLRLGYRLDRIEPDEIEAPGEVGRSMIWVYPA
jgi:RimJ/RimL family protein N-acetyltransferase